MTKITGDPYLANAIVHIRAASRELKADLDAAEWMQGKSIEQIQGRIRLFKDQYRASGEQGALDMADSLEQFLAHRL